MKMKAYNWSIFIHVENKDHEETNCIEKLSNALV